MTEESLEERFRESSEVDTSPKPANLDEDMRVEVINKGWFRRKDVMYSVEDGKRRKILNCREEDIREVSDLLLAPYQDRVLFTAEGIKEGLKDIYVVNVTGSNLVRATFNGEARYLTNPGDLKWTSSTKFMYPVPEDTDQTYDFRCKDEPHVHEITLSSSNALVRIDSYYYDNGRLVKESFTQEEVEEVFSKFYESFKENHEDFEQHKKKLERSLKSAEKGAKKAKESKDNGLLKGITMLASLKYLELIPDIEKWTGIVQGYLDVLNKHKDEIKDWPKEPEKIGHLRGYLGQLEYWNAHIGSVIRKYM